MDNRKDFIVQLRIMDRSILNRLDDYTENIRNAILNGPDCRGTACRNCETAYVFRYREKEYHKCHTMLCNFIFRNPTREDIPTLLGIVEHEIVYSLSKGKKS